MDELNFTNILTEDTKLDSRTRESGYMVSLVESINDSDRNGYNEVESKLAIWRREMSVIHRLH